VTGPAIAQIVVFIALLTAICVPVGAYMARVYEGRARWMQRMLGPVERLLYRGMGVDPAEDQPWTRYAMGVLWFSLFAVLVCYAMQRLQASLPLNPAGFANVPPGVSFNTAVSFATNTNWQAYGGETTMSHLVQMAALAVQNFMSAAVGMAVVVAMIRGFTRRHADGIGNFWVDVTRTTLYILIPFSIVFALYLVFAGIPQTFHAVAGAQTLQHAADGSIVPQGFALGPVASQIAIKMLGTNGGGYYNANAAHPFENPTVVANFLQTLSIFVIGGGLCFMLGHLVKARRQGLAIFAAMMLLFAPIAVVTVYAEQHGNPALADTGVTQAPSETQGGGNMEGKEVRFGAASSALFAVVTTSASCGAVDSWHDSYTPLGGLFPMWLMELGEVVVGGVGSGLYVMLLFAIVAVFLAGLMVGRTPEFLGKKIEAFEMKMATLGILIPSVCALIGTAIAVSYGGSHVSGDGSVLTNHGPHGFSEVLYGMSSMAANNGSAFGGLTASNTFWTSVGGVIMWVSRFFPIVCVLAVAGSLAKKKYIPASSGTLPTDGPLFVVLLASVVILVGALTFLPALGLGPIAEHFQRFVSRNP
jgi:potassium-transporting ATPase potassium-binding subunit